MRQLPYVETLGEAVHEVIKGKYSSKSIIPYYRDLMLSASLPEKLIEACKKSIENTKNTNGIVKAINKDPYALTIEDFVSVYGSEWGFNNYTIKVAKDRVKVFNDIAGKERYGSIE